VRIRSGSPACFAFAAWLRSLIYRSGSRPLAGLRCGGAEPRHRLWQKFRGAPTGISSTSSPPPPRAYGTSAPPPASAGRATSCSIRSKPASISGRSPEKNTHNFEFALPEHFAELADEKLKRSYNLDFPGLRLAVRERELEDCLVTRLQSFLLELAAGPERVEGATGFASLAASTASSSGRRSTSSISSSIPAHRAGLKVGPSELEIRLT
jgi:hypothetical protein